MYPILISPQDASIIIGNSEYPKGGLTFVVQDNSKVSIQIFANGRKVTDFVKYDQYKNASNVPYTSLATLVADLRAALFSNFITP